MKTQPLYQTSHPLYLCHHTVSTDISPTFVWHHNRIGITSQQGYLWHHIQYIDMTHTVSGKQNEYTWHLTHCIWHHSHCICAVTPALSMPSQHLWKSSHLAPVWHHTHPTSHQILTLWHQSSLFRTSQALHSWHTISYIWNRIHSLWDLIPYTCAITATMLVT